MLTIILIIAGVVLAKFIYDTVKQSNDVKASGGISTRFSELIGYLLDGSPKAKILQENNTFVMVGVTGSAGSTTFSIFPSYGTVTIRMAVKNNPLCRDFTKEWSFPEDMDQYDMYININNDIKQLYNL